MLNLLVKLYTIPVVWIDLVLQAQDFYSFHPEMLQNPQNIGAADHRKTNKSVSGEENCPDVPVLQAYWLAGLETCPRA